MRLFYVFIIILTTIRSLIFTQWSFNTFNIQPMMSACSHSVSNIFFAYLTWSRGCYDLKQFLFITKKETLDAVAESSIFLLCARRGIHQRQSHQCWQLLPIVALEHSQFLFLSLAIYLQFLLRECSHHFNRGTYLSTYGISV